MILEIIYGKDSKEKSNVLTPHNFVLPQPTCTILINANIITSVLVLYLCAI